MHSLLQTLLGVLVLGLSAPSWAAELKLSFSLWPAGSFEAVTSEVQGQVSGKGDALQATDVVVRMNAFKTGIALRDKHLRERLQADKYPAAKLSQITGKGGRGSGLLEYRSFKKKIDFTYSADPAKKQVTANFELKISDFGLDDKIMYMGVGVEDELTAVITLPLAGN